MTGDRDDDATMERLELWRSSAMWVVWNYLVEFWWPLKRGRTVRIRYEDFVERPRETVERIAQLLDLDTSQTPFVDERSVRMQPTHTVAGNPNRHDRGLVTLRPDEEWRRAMPVLHALSCHCSRCRGCATSATRSAAELRVRARAAASRTAYGVVTVIGFDHFDVPIALTALTM